MTTPTVNIKHLRYALDLFVHLQRGKPKSFRTVHVEIQDKALVLDGRTNDGSQFIARLPVFGTGSITPITLYTWNMVDILKTYRARTESLELRSDIVDGEAALWVGKTWAKEATKLYFPFPWASWKQHAALQLDNKGLDRVRAVYVAHSDDDARPILQCVVVEVHRLGIEFVATDGFRIARTGKLSGAVKSRILIQPDGVKVINHLPLLAAADIKILYGFGPDKKENTVFEMDFTYDDIAYTLYDVTDYTHETRYPDYRSIWKKNFFRFGVNATELREAILPFLEKGSVYRFITLARAEGGRLEVGYRDNGAFQCCRTLAVSVPLPRRHLFSVDVGYMNDALRGIKDAAEMVTIGIQIDPPVTEDNEKTFGHFPARHQPFEMILGDMHHLIMPIHTDPMEDEK
jgi:hypothetical protein